MRIVFILLFASGVMAQQAPGTPPVGEIVSRMNAMNQARAAALRGYRNSRTYMVNYKGFPKSLAAKALVRTQTPDVADEGDRIVAEFKTRFVDTDLFDKEFASGLLRGFAQIGEGAFSVLGAASGDPAMSAGLQGAGKTSEGMAGVLAAGIDRDAKQLEVGAELEMAAMKQNADEIAKAIQRAQDASNAMQQVTSQLVTLAGNMFAAVRLG